MPWLGSFAAALAGVALVELLLAEILPAVAESLDLFLLLVVLVGLGGNSLRGLGAGIAAGLVQDVLVASPIGLHALACCIVGYAVARLSQRVVTARPGVAVPILAAALVVHRAVVVGLFALLGLPGLGERAGVPLQIGATVALGVPLLWLLRRQQALRTGPSRSG